MTKEEQIRELERQQKEIQDKIEELKKEPPKRWRADDNEEYFFVNDCGGISEFYDVGGITHDSRYKKGNYFKTVEQAKASIFYFVLNSEYFYWLPGMELPSEQPKDHESLVKGDWVVYDMPLERWQEFKTVRRWKK